MSLLQKDVESPLGVRPHGEAGRTKAVDWLPSETLQQGTSTANILPKLILGYPIHRPVPPGVAGYLVARIGNPSHERGLTLCQPADRKKGPAMSLLREKLQQSINACLGPAGPLVPVCRVDGPLKRQHMEVLLQPSPRSSATADTTARPRRNGPARGRAPPGC